MIRVQIGELADTPADGAVRAVRTDLAPVNASARDLLLSAGPDVAERLEKMGSMPIGGACMTPGGALAADFLIHVVVMSSDEPQTNLTVQRALKNGLRRAADWSLESLALPPLGLGVGIVEPEVAATALIELLLDHIDEGQPPSDFVIVVSSSYEADLFTRRVEDVTRERERE